MQTFLTACQILTRSKVRLVPRLLTRFPQGQYQLKINKTKQKEILSNESMKKEDESSSHPQTEYEKFNEWIKRKAPYCSNPNNFTSQITESEFIKLKEKYSAQQVADVIMQIENRKGLSVFFSNLCLTVLNWLKNEQNNGTPKEAEQSTDAISRLHPALR